METKNIKVYPTFKKISLLNKIMRKISLKLGIGVSKWYDDWKKELDIVDTIIVFATNRIDHIEYIKKHSPNIRLILWYWNPVEKMINPMTFAKDLCELWSYDKVDCLKYNMQYNNTFFFKEIEIDNNDKEFDLLFLGFDKGRRLSIEELKKQMIIYEVKGYYHIVPDIGNAKNDSPKPMNYSNYLKLVSMSKCILDLMPNENNGMTLRPMEALFFKRKLITNFIAIKDEPFYDSKNIFILGIDDFSRIKQFIDSDYNEIDYKIMKEYEFKNWLSHFFIGGIN
ncbi:hypothetical protein [Flavobacterium granuli]|uniref:Uncharacterized protein n=1 Tax=Flavobacterium granuli TaxID=280093 RepID=A0ABU1S7Y4_9FLAO|nr:hypothetical protein [Flavobacterium granuli]MDR6846395.1 hypothetical protein [Flavobacterium granuli]